MKLSISNIAWEEKYDEEVHSFLKGIGFQGLEIAPTRIVGLNPYTNKEAARKICEDLYKKYGLDISSMQSIWYGIEYEIFKSRKEYEFLINYTKSAIDFATEIGCKNLVFGCPKNRNTNNYEDINIAKDFFRVLGGYASTNGVTIGIEANPKIYNTNFLNTTLEVLNFVEELNCQGIGINIDLGTIIANEEDINIIKNSSKYISHVHISEPYLEKIEKRDIHKKLVSILRDINYDNYISIEMKNLNDINLVKETCEYIKGLL